jgi:hypothetical protein
VTAVPRFDAYFLVGVLREHDEKQGNVPDSNGRIAGIVDNLSLSEAAHCRIREFLKESGTPAGRAQLEALLATVWADGFAVGALAARHKEGMRES